MKKHGEEVISIFIFIIVIIGGYYFFFANKQTKEEPQIMKQEKVLKSNLIAKELANKYQATTGWEKNLTYTLQAQERLVTGKPTLFTGSVGDIFNRNGKTFVTFFSSYLSSVNYMLELECNKKILNKVLTGQQNKKDNIMIFPESYAIIANIQSVYSPVFTLEGSRVDIGVPEDIVDIDVEPSGLFIAKGTCVDIEHIPSEQ